MRTVFEPGTTHYYPGNAREIQTTEKDIFGEFLDLAVERKIDHSQEGTGSPYSPEQLVVQDILGEPSSRLYTSWPARLIYGTLYAMAYSEGSMWQSSPEIIRYEESAITDRGVGGIAVI